MDDKNFVNNSDKSEKPKLQLRTIFYHNTFVLVFSFVCAIVIWFSMAASKDHDQPVQIYDVPITIEFSDAAKEQGIRVFSQSYTAADISVTGNKLIIDKVTAKDVSVTAQLSPNSTKLTGNTMATETIQLVAQKGNTLADYEVSDVSPKEINVMYDKYKETTFNLENNIKYTATNDYSVETPIISSEKVVVSGPQSSVNKVARVAIDYNISDPLTATRSFSCPLTAYDANNEPLELTDLFLTLSVETVDVTIPVKNKQTVKLELTKLNVPEGFSDSRIVIDPETIDIAGDAETISKYKTITLTKAIDFSEINIKKNSFKTEIPMPSGVTNVSKVTEATVTVNLSGFTEANVNVQSFEFINVPDNKSVSMVTKTLPVTIVGSQAQVGRITPTSVYGTIDMAGLADKNGNVEVPVTISISGSTSCWVYGQYTVQVNVQEAKAATAEVTAEPKKN